MNSQYIKTNFLFLKEYYKYDNKHLVKMLDVPISILNRLSKLEYDKIKNTDIKVFISLCSFFDISLMDLFYTDLRSNPLFLKERINNVKLVNNQTKIFLRKNLKYMAKINKLSFDDLASCTHKSSGRYCFYYSNRIKQCGLMIQEVIAFCRRFNVTLDEFVFHDLKSENRIVTNIQTKGYRKHRIKRGDIYLANLGTGIGCEENGIRPVIILQNNTGNRFSPTTIVACMTSKKREKLLPTQMKVKIESERSSLIITEQIRTIDKKRLIKYIGTMPDEMFLDVSSKLDVSLGMRRNRKSYSVANCHK